MNGTSRAVSPNKSEQRTDLRVLTVKQPWADLIMAGVKDVENRTWPVPSTLPEWYSCEFCFGRQRRDSRGAIHLHQHNGRHFDSEPDGPFPFTLGIHAAKQWDDDWTITGSGAYEHRELGRHAAPYGRVEAGALLGTVTVTGCHHARECSFGLSPEPDSQYACTDWAEPWATTEHEQLYHWTLADPQPLDEPIPMRGLQRLWTTDALRTQQQQAPSKREV